MSIPEWFQHSLPALDQDKIQAAVNHQNQLTKPPGSLGRLEDIAVFLSSLNDEAPKVDPVHISIFASDHGIAAQGVSAFPQSVTAEMVRNFSNGGAAISVLAKSLDAKLEIINLGTVEELEPLKGVLDNRIAAGTADFSQTKAMNEHQVSLAVNVGRQTVERAYLAGAKLFIGGEMGIANTTSATALACALTDFTPTEMTGAGTGLNAESIQHKATVIDKALNKHDWNTPWECLMTFGGFEIAALTGAYISCARMGMPVVVDGFIASAAALVAERICPGVAERLIFSHQSTELGHQKILEELNANPLINLNMRLGEGSGAAVVVPLLRMACDLHNNMASFTDAKVSKSLS